jgi:hypothetical protein
LGFRGLRGCHWHCGWLWCCVDLGPGSDPTFGGGGGPTFECVEVGLVLLVAVLCSVVHTPAYVAECGVAALGRSVTEVPALETSDEAVLVDRWRATKGGQVAYRVASLAVVAVRTGDREAVLFELDIAQPLLVGQVEPGLRVLLLLLLLLLLLVVVVLAVAIVLVSRVFRRPLVGRTTTIGICVGNSTVLVHIALLVSLGLLRVDLFVSAIRVVGVVVVAGIAITITITISVAILLWPTILSKMTRLAANGAIPLVVVVVVVVSVVVSIMIIRTRLARSVVHSGVHFVMLGFGKLVRSAKWVVIVDSGRFLTSRDRRRREKEIRKRDERRKRERKCFLNVLLLLSNVVNVEKRRRRRGKQRYYADRVNCFAGRRMLF